MSKHPARIISFALLLVVLTARGAWACPIFMAADGRLVATTG